MRCPPCFTKKTQQSKVVHWNSHSCQATSFSHIIKAILLTKDVFIPRVSVIPIDFSFEFHTSVLSELKYYHDHQQGTRTTPMVTSLYFILWLDSQTTFLHCHLIRKAIMLCTQRPYQPKGWHYLFCSSEYFSIKATFSCVK